MAFNDELGNRMKQNYETISKIRLTRRTPVAIRIDGKVPLGYKVKNEEN